MNFYIGVAEAARRLCVRPRHISDLFYDGRLDVTRCPVVAGRRMIPETYLDAIAIELRRARRLPPLPTPEEVANAD